MQTINVRGEERESYLDAFSLCETFFREEAGQASQLFDDLGRHCPSDLTLCEPLPDVDEMRASAAFLSALGALGVADAATLAAATGASPGDCEGVMANPLRCDAAARARVLQAVEDSPGLAPWFAVDEASGLTVGEELARWTRGNFKTPQQFRRQAMVCELKCYLVGAVESLEGFEVESLLSCASIVDALKQAAMDAGAKAGRSGEGAGAAGAASAGAAGAASAEALAKRGAGGGFAAVPKAHH